MNRSNTTLPLASGRLSWWGPMLTFACFGALLQLSLSRLNPDWLSYQLIYETGGAWLSDQNRDLAFLALNSFVSGILGSDSYETYRTLLALYFMVFVVLLSAGRILRINPAGGGYLSLFLALIYLGLARFTVQIREGLAISLVIIAFALFVKHSSKQKTDLPGAVRKINIGRVLKTGVAWFLLLLAGMTHAGTLLVLLIALASWWATERSVRGHGTALGRARSWRMRLLWMSAFVLAGTIVIQLYLGGAIQSFAADTVGDRLVDVKPLSLDQLGLWILYGVVCWLVFREARAGVVEGRISGIPATFLRVLSGPALMAIYASIVFALLLAITPLVISGYVRLLNMLLALVLVCLAVIGRRGWLMVMVSMFLIMDQIRSIADSISIYFGVKIF